jgi:rhamnosyltransferase
MNSAPSVTADSHGQTRVMAVIVIYHPDEDRLHALTDAIAPQVHHIVIVDNSETAIADQASGGHTSPDHTYIHQSDNPGLGNAQNRGIMEALRRGASHVLLLDQDSVPHECMVDELLAGLARLGTTGAKVAAVGPLYVDQRLDDRSPFVWLRGFRFVPRRCESTRDLVAADHVISSGSLIPAPVLDEVGLMDETLFIDFVDVEWCWRARSRGFDCYGICSARMTHEIGNEPYEFGGRKISRHAAIRHYYQFRNAVLLFRRPYLSLQWKIAVGLRLLLRLVFSIMLAKPRGDTLHMIVVGVWHGMRNHTGRYRRP